MVHMPNEIVEYIFSLIDPADSVTCAAVCRTGAIGRKAATPLCYHTVGVTRRKLSSREHIRKLCLLIRTLLENPRLASYVKTYQHFYKATDPDGDDGRNHLERLLTKKAIPHPPWTKKAGKERDGDGAEEKDKYRGHLKHLAYAQTILWMCPNVACLELCGDICPNLKWWEIGRELFQYSQESKSSRFGGSLQLIKEVRIVDMLDIETCSSTLKTIEPIMFLGYLERITIDGLKPRFIGVRRWPLFSGALSTTVKDLVLTSCGAKSEEIAELLGGWPDLRTVVIEWDTRREERSANWWNEICSRLASCTKLERLELNECNRSFSLDFLPSFPSLTHLTMTMSRSAADRETLGRLLLDRKYILARKHANEDW
jgi:hypothetical protein